MRYCIDPGHGGSDPGAVGAKSKEKNHNLAIGLLLKAALQRKGHKVVMTRGNDSYVSLSMRCKIANNFKADRYISIHCNSSVIKKANGTETLYKSQRGKDMAGAIQKSLIKTLGTRDRGLRFRDDLHVLNGTNMPAVLIETAFISNANEERILLTKQKEIANAIAAVL